MSFHLKFSRSCFLFIAASTAAADYLKLMQIAIAPRDRQRFRVAVSLALGIGQYAGQGTRRIESFILEGLYSRVER